MRIPLLFLSVVTAFAAVSCNSGNASPSETPEPQPVPGIFAKGADISWCTEMERDGITFRNYDGTAAECTALMKELGFDAIRLRVWVDPEEGWCGKEDVLAKAGRARDLGMRLMIDFHYSDWWADPQQQNIPSAWNGYSIGQLCQAVADHTADILTALKDNGITPEWVQVGNETSNGMLWDAGKADVSMASYAMLSNAGYDAVKSVFPEAKVIVHLDHGDNPDLYEWLFSGLKSNGGKWDMIGMSVYPEYYVADGQYDSGDYRAVVSATVSNMASLYQLFGTPVMICEAGMSWDMPDEAYAFLCDLKDRSRALGEGICAGVFYWEPQTNPAWTPSIYSELGWSSYDKGAFDRDFRPTKALEAFKN
ncbi:MAG TPA: arabinogalactan endo-1,4-beta-galactosidase [Candidatus Coprenecus pullistercoris]|nr:arabinogalactan endo-1,4-beta-galactosidase [Candidatus Coprenecus pullistercoris]